MVLLGVLTHFYRNTERLCNLAFYPFPLCIARIMVPIETKRAKHSCSDVLDGSVHNDDHNDTPEYSLPELIERREASLVKHNTLDILKHSSKVLANGSKFKGITKCTERDVLMGRGKRVAEWPGNVVFRQIVARYRHAYITEQRSSKMKIALHVVKEVHKRKGRFLREINGRSSCDGHDTTAVWEIVTQARAIEKACQALRERIVPLDGLAEDLERNGNKDVERKKKAFSTKDIRQRITPEGRLKKKLRTNNSLTTKKSDEVKPVHVHFPNSTSQKNVDELVPKFSTQQQPITVNERAIVCKKEQWETLDEQQHLTRSVQNKSLQQASLLDLPNDDEMLKKIIDFYAVHKHTAVPTGWIKDKVLADWCTLQRQIHRKITLGYIDFHDELSTQQQETYLSLQDLNFCFEDYDEWHWKHYFGETVRLQQHPKSQRESLHKHIDDTRKISNTEHWLEDQQKQIQEGFPIPASRLDRLEEIGFFLH